MTALHLSLGNGWSVFLNEFHTSIVAAIADPGIEKREVKRSPSFYLSDWTWTSGLYHPNRFGKAWKSKLLHDILALSFVILRLFFDIFRISLCTSRRCIFYALPNDSWQKWCQKNHNSDMKFWYVLPVQNLINGWWCRIATVILSLNGQSVNNCVWNIYP